MKKYNKRELIRCMLDIGLPQHANALRKVFEGFEWVSVDLLDPKKPLRGILEKSARNYRSHARKAFQIADRVPGLGSTGAEKVQEIFNVIQDKKKTALVCFLLGEKGPYIAEVLGVGTTTVYRWRDEK